MNDRSFRQNQHNSPFAPQGSSPVCSVYQVQADSPVGAAGAGRQHTHPSAEAEDHHRAVASAGACLEAYLAAYWEACLAGRIPVEVGAWDMPGPGLAEGSLVCFLLGAGMEGCCSEDMSVSSRGRTEAFRLASRVGCSCAEGWQAWAGRACEGPVRALLVEVQVQGLEVLVLVQVQVLTLALVQRWLRTTPVSSETV